MSDRPSDRPDRTPVFVYGGPSTITRGVKEVPAWYAKYQSHPEQQQQQQQAPPDTLTSPAPTPSTSYATVRPLSGGGGGGSIDEGRPRHASTGSIDMASSPTSSEGGGGGGSGAGDSTRSRRSSSGSTGNVFPSLRPDPSTPRPSLAGQGGGGGTGGGGGAPHHQRRDSMGRLFTGLTSQKREGNAVDESGRRESWNEQKMQMGGGVSRMVGGWWDGWLRGSGSGSGGSGSGGGSRE